MQDIALKITGFRSTFSNHHSCQKNDFIIKLEPRTHPSHD